MKQRKSPSQKARDKQRQMEFMKRKTMSSRTQVLGRSSSDGGEGGGPPIPTPPPPSPPPPPPLPPSPPPALTTRRVVVTAGRLRTGISFEQIDGECDVSVDGNDEEEGANGLGPLAGSEDAAGAAALVVDADAADDS